jgi:prolycopene isomerase
VFSDRHYGGVNYPQGGVGQIAIKLATGLVNHGGKIRYRARVTQILTGNGRAIGVQLADGTQLHAHRIIANSTRWQTFGELLPTVPSQEQRWRSRYQPSPSFVSLHLGVKSDAIPSGLDCHHILLSDWETMEQSGGTVFVSIPTLLDPSLAPPGHHIVHAFTPSWIQEWQGLSPSQYRQRKAIAAQSLIQRLSQFCRDSRSRLSFRKWGHRAPIAGSSDVRMEPMAQFQPDS